MHEAGTFAFLASTSLLGLARLGRVGQCRFIHNLGALDDDYSLLHYAFLEYRTDRG